MPVRSLEQFDKFAQDECTADAVYSELARAERDPKTRNILAELARHEARHYAFWRKLSSKKAFAANPIEVFAIMMLRLILGLTFTAKFLERQEKEAIAEYSRFLKAKDRRMWREGRRIVHDEMHHEHSLRSMIREERVEFISSIVLGLNDAIIELTGVLVGLSFVLTNSMLVAVTGLVTGIAASLSMAASAYMQASHEKKKDAGKAATYTGVTYFAVVLLLIAPFFITSNVIAALGVMFAVVLLIITSISYYSSVLLERDFKQQFGKMLLFSVGVSIVSFALGSLFRSLTGIEA